MTYLLEDTGNRQYICTEIERARSIIPNATLDDLVLDDYIVAYVKSVSYGGREGEFTSPGAHNIFVFNKANIKSCRHLTPTDVIDIVVDSDDMVYSVDDHVKW